MDRSVPERQAHLARAIAELNAGHDAAARTRCLHLLEVDPNDPAAHQVLATIAFRAGRLAEAEQHVSLSIAVRSTHGPTWLLGGQIAQAAGAFDLAVTRLSRAVALDPTREDAAFAHCRIWIALAGTEQSAMSDHPDPGKLVADLLARFPDYAPGWAAVGADLERVGQLDAALIAWNRAAKAAPSVAGFLRCAQLALRLSRPNEATDALQSALSLDPALAGVWFKLGVVLQDCRDFAGAIAAYQRALALDADLAEAATNLGIVLQETGDLDAAKRAYGRAIRVRTDSFGRISQALTAAPKGELWTDLTALRAHLLDCGD